MAAQLTSWHMRIALSLKVAGKHSRPQSRLLFLANGAWAREERWLWPWMHDLTGLIFRLRSSLIAVQTEPKRILTKEIKIRI